MENTQTKRRIENSEVRLDLLAISLECQANQIGYIATVQNFRNASTKRIEDAVAMISREGMPITQIAKIKHWYAEFLWWLKLKNRIEETNSLAKYF
jgi:hypothetical protein